MKKLLNTIAGALLANARTRAAAAMRKQAQVRAPFQEHYASNAGGWN